MSEAGAVSVAPYAVVRRTALEVPLGDPDVDRFRATATNLVRLCRWTVQVAPELADVLYKEIAVAGPDRRRALLAVRRCVHNGRRPRAAVLAELAAGEERLPLLDHWIGTLDEIEQLSETLVELAGPALRADRVMLARRCADESLRRAIALTSETLLGALDRTVNAAGAPDARARKSEPTVLRYVQRAAMRTTPLSWFSRVGWGVWTDGVDGHAVDDGEPVGFVEADRTPLEALIQAVLDDPRQRDRIPHRLAPGLSYDSDTVSFRRLASADDTPAGVVREERVAMGITGPLRHVLSRLTDGAALPLPELSAGLAAQLPGEPDAATRGAQRYVTQLVDAGMLRPAWPIDPQSPDALEDTAAWLRRVGLPDGANELARIAELTAGYTGLPAARRPARLAALRAAWSDAFRVAGADLEVRGNPVTEDVTVAAIATLGVEHGAATRHDLARLIPLIELFDQYIVVRRMVRDRFVARFGVGGRCASLADFAGEYLPVWQALEVFGAKRSPDTPRSDGLEHLVRLRTGLAEAIACRTESPEIVLDDADLDGIVLPDWVTARPNSYGLFVQPATDHGAQRLCLNRVFSGWGRFTSRFLTRFDPIASVQVSAQIGSTLRGRRPVQVRPVRGFNANLHPRLVADEIADEPQFGTLRPEQLELVHDPASDQVRVRIAATGEPIDVLYLGFLLEAALPDRFMPLVTDLASGLVTLESDLVGWRTLQTPVGEVGYRPRLRYRDVVLCRAQWHLPPEIVAAWRGELDAEPGTPVRATARWQAALDLPEHVFVGAGTAVEGSGLAALRSYFDRPKAQHVDFGSAIHLQCLSRTLSRYPDTIRVEEALPSPRPGHRSEELVAEIYRRAT